MTQRQHSHTGDIPACPEGHAARHIEDLRAPHAGGGHSIECQCRKTARHPTFEEAMREWCASMRIRVPRWVAKERDSSDADEAENVVQFALPLGGRR